MNLDKLCGFDSFCHSIPVFPTDSVTAGNGGGGKVSKVDSDAGDDTPVIYVSGPLIVQKGDTRVEFNSNGGVAVKMNGVCIEVGSDGDVKVYPAPANDTAAKATHEIGATEITGEHKGEIYGGLYPGDNKPIWISEEPKRLTHYEACELKGRALPTREEGKYIDTIKGKGDLKDIFARHSDGSSPAGYFWLAEPNYYLARFQQFSNGHQFNNFTNRNNELPVLSVRR